MSIRIAQHFAYEIEKDSVRIWRCFSHDSKAVIPEFLEGHPVTEIAPYAFSGHMDEGVLEGKCVTFGEGAAALSKMQELISLCGNRLEEIELPSTVTKVGRYCFYNCKNLHKISFSGNLNDWGSGAFTGCHQVNQLEVVMYGEETSSLKDVLTELQEPLVVDYRFADASSGYHVKLVFPDYYEDGVENTPAKLINIAIYGSGLKFRNCFQKRVFQFGEYDRRFSYAVSQESFETAALMAEYRLRYPHGLHESAKGDFEKYLLEHKEAYGAFVVNRRELDVLIWYVKLLFEHMVPEEALLQLNQMIEEAALKQYHEGVSYLMDYKHRHSSVKKKVYDFTL